MVGGLPTVETAAARASPTELVRTVNFFPAVDRAVTSVHASRSTRNCPVSFPGNRPHHPCVGLTQETGAEGDLRRRDSSGRESRHGPVRMRPQQTEERP